MTFFIARVASKEGRGPCALCLVQRKARGLFPHYSISQPKVCRGPHPLLGPDWLLLVWLSSPWLIATGTELLATLELVTGCLDRSLHSLPLKIFFILIYSFSLLRLLLTKLTIHRPPSIRQFLSPLSSLSFLDHSNTFLNLPVPVFHRFKLECYCY